MPTLSFFLLFKASDMYACAKFVTVPSVVSIQFNL